MHCRTLIGNNVNIFSHSRGIVIFTPGKKVKTTTATDFPITTKRHQNRRSRKEIRKSTKKNNKKGEERSNSRSKQVIEEKTKEDKRRQKKTKEDKKRQKKTKEDKRRQ